MEFHALGKERAPSGAANRGGCPHGEPIVNRLDFDAHPRVCGILAGLWLNEARIKGAAMLVRCLFAVLAILALSATQADARRGVLQFGMQEDVHFLQNIRLKGPRGQMLYLGYITRTQNFFLPIYVTDGGYALATGDREGYFPVPTGAELARLQEAGALPNPLPPYRLTVGNYVMGYFLWMMLIMLGLGFAIYSVLRKQVQDAYDEADRAAADAERARRI